MAWSSTSTAWRAGGSSRAWRSGRSRATRARARGVQGDPHRAADPHRRHRGLASRRGVRGRQLHPGARARLPTSTAPPVPQARNGGCMTARTPGPWSTAPPAPDTPSKAAPDGCGTRPPPSSPGRTTPRYTHTTRRHRPPRREIPSGRLDFRTAQGVRRRAAGHQAGPEIERAGNGVVPPQPCLGDGLAIAREYAREHATLAAPADTVIRGFPIGKWLENERAQDHKSGLERARGPGGVPWSGVAAITSRDLLPPHRATTPLCGIRSAHRTRGRRYLPPALAAGRPCLCSRP